MRRFLIIIVSLLAGPTFASDTEKFEGECGIGTKVKGYKFEHAGYEYLMPMQGNLLRSGEEIYRYKRVYDWWENYNGLEISHTKDFLIIRAWDTDCVDLSSAQIILLSNEGDYYLHQDEWTSNWKAGFFLENDRLSYWSEWFCHESRQKVKSEESYIYTLDPSLKQFVKTTVPYEKYCSSVYKSNFENIAIKYEALPPIK